MSSNDMSALNRRPGAKPDCYGLNPATYTKLKMLAVYIGGFVYVGSLGVIVAADGGQWKVWANGTPAHFIYVGRSKDHLSPPSGTKRDCSLITRCPSAA